MARNFNNDDKGKSVVTADGDMVGTVDSITGSTAHVKPHDDLSRSTRRRLGWAEEGEDMYELRHSKVESIDDDEIRLTKEL